jgi:RNA polymerase sigma-70 factor (ECF subfamily)
MVDRTWWGETAMYVNGQRFEELYREYWPHVFTLCQTRLGDYDEALDAAQEVFVRKWQALGRYDPARASFRTWLSRNAENLCVDLLRLRGRQPPPEALPEEWEALGQEPFSEERTIRQVIVNQCLTVLPPDVRQLVLLREVEEYTWEEMAALTDLTVSQVRTRTTQGEEVLRALLLRSGIEVAP